MSAPNDGGAAFPCRGDGISSPSQGMSLRDYFAGKALAGLLADHEYDPLFRDAARAAYLLADAMLAARAGRGE